ncbi:MAG TPA: hypothetical protein DIW64_13040 [Cellvibrio sp.]|nr:hypothetical protein [Cellvibrio sp.]
MNKLSPFSVSLLFLSLFVAPPVFAEQRSLTLEEFLTQVDTSNPGLSAAQQYNKALQHRIKPAGALDDPFVAFGMDEIPYGEQSPQAYRYQISQSLPFPGKRGTREKIAALKAETAEQETATQRRELKVIATQFFYRTFFNAQAINLNLQLQTAVGSAMQSAKARYEAGGTEHHDWLLAKMELATLAIEQQKLKREQFWLRTSLNELRGHPPEADLPISVVDFTHTTEPAFTETEFNDQPELAVLDAQTQQSAHEYKLAKLSYYPDFVLQIMAMEPRNMGEMDTEKSNWGVMVGMTVPLYFGHKQSHLVTAARYEQQAVESDKVYLRNKLISESVNAKQALISARDLVRLYETDVLPNTQLALADARSAYQSRRMNLSQYVAIEKIQAIQQLELVAARIDVELAKTRLNELLSSPPILKLAPSRPTVFGAGNMGDAMPASDTVNMGGGMSQPKPAGKKSSTTDQGGNSGMGGM